MGGDRAPGVPVAAALRAIREHDLDVILVGDPSALSAAGAGPGVAVVGASQVVGMSEDGALAVRAKHDASVRVAIRLVAEGAADAALSAGSTGATLAAALLGLGRVPGIRRPAIAAVLPRPPTAGGGSGGIVLVDAGASTDVHPEALLAHARMGAAYARLRGVAEPRVGLLNVGAEPGKGNELVKAAFALLSAERGFLGNVEPSAVLAGEADVVVTDGFTGNVFLKTLEAVSGPRAAYGGPGAAILLGVSGPVLVAHGAADVDELVAALRTAGDVASQRLVSRLSETLR